MRAEEIKQYWNERAVTSLETATTNDVYLRRVEAYALSQVIRKHSPGFVADVGSGDGRTTHRVALEFPSTTFVGYDFAPEMVRMARDRWKMSNLVFFGGDISFPLPVKHGLIYTTRCLINLPSWNDQIRAILNIHQSLCEGGIYVMIENFMEGQIALNEQRHKYGLPEIAVRGHNLFFRRDPLITIVSSLFKILDECNISSTYYLATRVLYARICMDRGEDPDYTSTHHRLAAELPWAGEYGPVRMIVMQKEA